MLPHKRKENPSREVWLVLASMFTSLPLQVRYNSLFAITLIFYFTAPWRRPGKKKGHVLMPKKRKKVQQQSEPSSTKRSELSDSQCMLHVHMY